MTTFDYGSNRWKRTSLKIRSENGYICQYCDELHKADLVDHVCELSDVILTPNYLKDYAFNRNNLIPCCHAAHNLKTAYMKRIRKDNTEIITKQNHPIIYYDNLPPIINLTDIDIIKPLVINHIRHIEQWIKA